jgi:hypothetical protein
MTQETFTGNVPYYGKRDVVVAYTIINKKLPTRPKDQIPSDTELGDRVWSLMVHCWAHNPEARPTADKVHNTVSMTQSHRA